MSRSMARPFSHHPLIAVSTIWAWIALTALAVVACGDAYSAARLPPRLPARHAVLLAASLQPYRVCFAQPVAENESQIVVLDSATGRSLAIGRPAHYTALRLSPTGGSLAALATPPSRGQAATLYLWNISTRAGQAVSLSASSGSTYVAWSPDGRDLAVVGATTYIFTASGKELAAAGGGTLGGSYSDGGYAWSPDSSQFATIVDGNLILLARGGQTRVESVSSIVPAAQAVPMVALMGWVGSRAVSLAGFPSGSPAWRVGSLWSQTPIVVSEGQVVPASQPRFGGGLASQISAAMDAVEPAVMWAHASADGGTDVYGIATGSTGGHPLALAVMSGSEVTVVRLPITASESLDGWLVDAVAVDA